MIPTKADIELVLAKARGNKVTWIKPGERLPFEFDRAGRSLKGWHLVITVHASLFDRPIICREIARYGKAWPGFLTIGETLRLAPGGYTLTGILCGKKKTRDRIGITFIVKERK